MTIFLTIMATFMVLGVVVVFFGNYNHYHDISDLDLKTLNILKGIGISFLYLVEIVFGLLSFSLLFLIPMIAYRVFRDNENDWEELSSHEVNL